MKATFNLILISFLVQLSCVYGQDNARQIGFYRFINAVGPGEGNTSVKINGSNIYDRGYRMGQRTGAMVLPTGSHEIKVEKEGVKSGSTQFQIETGETMSLVAFAERVESDDPEDPPEWTTRILRLKQNDVEEGFRISFISVCDVPVVYLQAMIGSGGETESVSVDRLGMNTLNLGNRKIEVAVTNGNDVITMVNPDARGNYVVIIYQDGDGQVKAMSFYEPRFVIAG